MVVAFPAGLAVPVLALVTTVEVEVVVSVPDGEVEEEAVCSGPPGLMVNVVVVIPPEIRG